MKVHKALNMIISIVANKSAPGTLQEQRTHIFFSTLMVTYSVWHFVDGMIFGISLPRTPLFGRPPGSFWQQISLIPATQPVNVSCERTDDAHRVQGGLANCLRNVFRSSQIHMQTRSLLDGRTKHKTCLRSSLDGCVSCTPCLSSSFNLFSCKQFSFGACQIGRFRDPSLLRASDCHIAASG